MSQKRSDRDLNGYRVIYMPGHPKAMKSENWNGYVYEHLVVVEKSLGRPLREDEVTHHLDEDRSNNRHDNLLVLERGQHIKLHEWLRRGAPRLKDLGEKGKNSGKPKFCKVCELTLQDKQKDYCSIECMGLDNRKVSRPDKTTLQKEILEESFLALGRKYGVSDNAVRKWAKQYGLSW